MAGGSGTDPLRCGSGAGRRWGCCSGLDDAGYGRGREQEQTCGIGKSICQEPGKGLSRGRGRGIVDLSRKEVLLEEKRVLENRLNLVNKELEDQ